MTGTLVAGVISTTNITTGKLNVTDGCTIGAWTVTKTGLSVTGETDANIQMNISASRYLTINKYPNDVIQPLLNVSSSNGTAITASSDSSGIALRVSGSRIGGWAIYSTGNHYFGMGALSGGIWNAPGLLWAGTIDINGNLEIQWGNGCTVSSTKNNGNGNYYIYHNLGTNAYFVYATVITDYCTAIVPYRYNNYFRVFIFNTNGVQVNAAFHVMIIGRNIVEQS